MLSKKQRPVKVPRTELSHPCSRPMSRTVRRKIERDVLKRVKPGSKFDELEWKWPEQCMMNSDVDMWGKHELTKAASLPKKSKGGGGQEWVCGFSGKTFKSEHYLDLHFEQNYMSETPGENGTCLADLCEPLDACKSSKDTAAWYDALASEPPDCDPNNLKKLQDQCVSALESCFPEEGSNYPDLHAQLSKTWCYPLTCPARAERHVQERRQLIFTLSILGVFGVVILFICMCFNDGSKDSSRKYDRQSLRAKKRL